MERFIITFGQIHAHRVNGHTFDKDCVAVVKAEDEALARAFAREHFKNEYHGSYPEYVFDSDDLIKYFPRGKLEAN